jgi:uncharacterized protein (TIGR03435 family)
VVGEGEACVLVFWATWCGSCLSEFPRLNELVKELSDESGNEPLNFVSIADEPRDKVQAMLAARKLGTRLALDDGGKTFDAYGVRVLPRVVLIDPEGKVAALPRLEDVSADVLRALAAGEALALPEGRSQPADVEWDEAKGPLDASASLAHVWLERSQSGSGAIRFPPGHGRITGDGVGFANLVQVAYGAEPHQVRSSHPLYEDFETVYRVSVKAPDDAPDTARAMLREQLARLFAHRAEWIEVTEPTPVLRRIQGAPLANLKPSHAAKSDGMARNGSIRFVKVPFERIVAVLGSFGLGGALLDETGLSGEHDIELEWTPGKVSEFKRALQGCGLEVVNEPRQVRKLVLGPG